MEENVERSDSESMSRVPGNTVQCIACKSPVHPGASQCPTCKSYQARWKYWLYFIARIASLLTIAFGVIVYIISGVPAVRKTLFWKDELHVLSFNSNQDIVIANSGDGETFVSHVALQAGRPAIRTTTLRLGITVPAGGFVKQALPGGQANATIVSGVPDDTWNEISRRSANSKDPCFFIVFFSAKDPSYLQIVDAYEGKVQEIPADAALHFYSTQKGKPLNVEFPVVAMVARQSINQCESIPNTGSSRSP